MTTAKELIKQNLVIDNAFGFEPEIEVPYKWDVLDRFTKAGFSYVSLSMATDMTTLSNTIHYLSETNAHILGNSDKYILVKTVDDIYRAKQTNKLAIGYMFQGTNPLEKDLQMVDVYYQLGIRSMILSYNIRNAMGDGCTETTDAGLSRLGEKLVEKMNQVGMLIDGSHTGYKTSMEAMEKSTKPVIFSHSNIYAVHPHPRNLKDEQIKMVAKTGGFIGINGIGPLLGDNNASIKKYVDHMEYVIKLVGDDYVGFGTDLVYFPKIFDSFMQKNAIFYSSNYNVASKQQWQSVQPEQNIEIVTELLNRGYGEGTIKKVLGENYLRVVKQTWK